MHNSTCFVTYSYLSEEGQEGDHDDDHDHDAQYFCIFLNYYYFICFIVWMALICFCTMQCENTNVYKAITINMSPKRTIQNQEGRKNTYRIFGVQ